MAKIKNILVSQPPPEREKDPYSELARKFEINFLFQKLFKIEGVKSLEFRQARINLLDYTAVIFTSKNAIDHYFRICKEMRVTVPDTMKYFCISESVSCYVQKYIQCRKRKIFFGRQHFSELTDVMKRYKNDTFLLPSSDIIKPEIPKLLEENSFNYKRIVFYRTVSYDLKEINFKQLDMIVLFSPAGVKALFENFPKFRQNKLIIATFGTTTAKAAKDSGLTVQITAPTAKAPSMAMALEQFLVKASKSK